MHTNKKLNHKIILGTPRSGTTFVSNWYANENKDHQRLSEEIGFEHFEPDHQSWPKMVLTKKQNLEYKNI